MNTHKSHRTDQSKRENGSSAYSRASGNAQLSQGHRTAGGPDYRSNDWQTSEHPRVKHSG